MAERPADQRHLDVLTNAFRRHVHCRRFHEGLSVGFVGEQRLHFAAQGFVSGACVIEKRGALTRLSVESGLMEAFHCGPAFHGLASKVGRLERLYRVFRNAINAALSAGESSSPNS